MLICSRPKSENANWEDPPQDDVPFDYNATPSQFYYSIESVGNLEPDSVVQQGIKVLQQKLAAVLQELTGGDDANRGAGIDGVENFADGPRSPDGGADQGFTTPYITGGGATSAWGGAQTPYGATPYGQSGWGS